MLLLTSIDRETLKSVLEQAMVNGGGEDPEVDTFNH